MNGFDGSWKGSRDGVDERRGVDLVGKGGRFVPTQRQCRCRFLRKTSPSEREGGVFECSEMGGVGVEVEGVGDGSRGDPSSR